MNYYKTPAQDLEIGKEDGLRVFIKREDMNHPFISGNKWWKLKHNLAEAKRIGKKKLLTFGGAYSNHLYASAAAAAEQEFQIIGIVRGERTEPLNPTLTFAREKGMEIVYVSREEYKKKNTPEFIEALAERFGDFFLIPEGGTNELAIKGVEEFGRLLAEEIEFDYLCLPVGTGGTIAGLIRALPHKKIVGFSSLKGGSFLEEEVMQWLTTPSHNWQVITDYHFGGYGKATQQLSNFIINFEKQCNVPLDRVYTGKMMYGVKDLFAKNFFDSGSRVLILHTGGLQGNSPRQEPEFS